MKTYVITTADRGAHHDIWLDHHRLRNEIFVERLGWRLSSHSGLEFDAYDTPVATYAVTVNDDGRACAVSRLLPTTHPYMIRDLWPDWHKRPLPESGRVWEASRFGCSASLDPADRKRAIGRLLAAIYRFGQQNDVETYLMVMPQFIFERIIKPLGYDVTYVGEPRVIDGLRTCLGRVRVEPEMPTQWVEDQAEINTGYGTIA